MTEIETNGRAFPRLAGLAGLVLGILALPCIAIMLWQPLRPALCAMEFVRTCESSAQCRLQPGFCCDSADSINTSYFDLCADIPSAHCQAICVTADRATCEQGRCGFELDDAASEKLRREAGVEGQGTRTSR